MPKLPQPRTAWTPPAARIEGDRLLRARAAAQRVADAKVQAEAEASRMQEFATATLDKKVDELRGQLDRLTEDLPKVIPSGGGGRRMVERVFTRDADRYRDALGLGTSATQNIARYPNRAAVSAGAVASDVTNILIDAYSSSAPSSGRANYKAATLAEYNAAPAALRLTDANGRRFVINESVIHVDMAGANPTGTGDSTAAFQAAADMIRARQVWPTAAGGIAVGVAPQGISWAGGTYILAGSVNMQGINSFAWTIDGRGGVVVLKCAGKTGFDLLGSRWTTWYSPVILGDATDSPAIGIQIGRLTTTGATDGHVFIAPQMDGVFTRCNIYNVASETTSYFQPALYNDDPTGNAYVMIIDGLNYWGEITDFTPSNVPQNTQMSCIQHTFYSADIKSRVSGKAMWFSRADQIKFYNSYAVSKDDAALYFLDNGNGFSDLHLDIHCESHLTAPGLQHNVLFDHMTPGGSTSVHKFYFNEEWSASALSPIGVASHMTTLRLYNADINVSYAGVVPSDGLFTNPTKVIVTGSISLPGVGSVIQTGNIALNGNIRGSSTSTRVFPRGSVTSTDQSLRTYHKGGYQFWGAEANPTTAGDQATKANVYIDDGSMYVRGDGSNQPYLVFTTGPANTTPLGYIAPIYANGNLAIAVGSHSFVLRSDGSLGLPSLGADPASPADGSIWNVGGVLRKRVSGVSSNV